MHKAKNGRQLRREFFRKPAGKDFFIHRLIALEALAFLLVIALPWFDELLDIPHLLLGAGPTPANWREALLETVLILPLAAAMIAYTMKTFNRMKYLEGLLSICASCKRIRDEQGNWQTVESYIHERSEASFSHGLCPHCAETLYPEVFGKEGGPPG